MSKKAIVAIIILILVILVIFLVGFAIYRNQPMNQVQTKNLTKIRIGWQIPWAVEGQLTQVLKHAPLLASNGLVGDFKGFSAGGPLNEAALAGDVDVIFTADQPAATLLVKNSNWVIIGRLMYNRVSLYVPPFSSINSVADLRGKMVAMPFGAAAQRMALKAEQDAGLNPQKDVNNINLGIYEQSDLVRDPKAVKWGKIDAMAGFDPTPAIFEEKGLVRNLQVGKVVSVIMMSKDFIDKNPAAPQEFMQAFYGAYDFYRKNVEQANQWFTAEAKLDITPKALEISAGLEPNLSTTTDKIRLDFNDEDYQIMQEAADFIYAQKLVTKRIIMKDYVNTSYVSQVTANPQ
ncbi:MAG: ABC transporter substrate-binding protein [Candidatus Parcubacteria bacterium]|nr:ABC transporter substrate-binding protein [Candidatus Parcubacteria bacterium]